MPVDSKHPLFNTIAPDWTLIATIKAGERAVKEAGILLLPQLDGQTPTQYKAYAARGSYYNAYARTISGLTGAATRNDPKVEGPPELLERTEDITGQGKKFSEVARLIIEEILTYGRFGILVGNPPEEGVERPYFGLYSGDSIINWRTEMREGAETLTMLCLLEYGEADDPQDEFARVIKKRIRVLDLVPGAGEGKEMLRVRLWEYDDKRKWTQIKVDDGEEMEVFPKIRGVSLDYIPFVFFGATDNSADPKKPPLLDLANLNVKHWQVSVDYYHGLHYCGLPTPWAAGFPANTKLYIGSKVAWITEDPQAKCGFLEFTGQGLTVMTSALEKIERQMAVVGARFLEEQKKAVETAEAIELRQTGDIATLGSIASTTEAGLTRALEFADRWMGRDGSSITVEMNRDFYSEKLDPQMLTALLSAVQAGEMSRETFLYNLKVGELLAKDDTVEDEQKRLEASDQKAFKNGPPLSGFGFVPGQATGATPAQRIQVVK